MLNFYIQELPNMHDGEEKVFPKLSTYNQFDNKKMIKRIAMEAGINEGVVMATLDAIPKALKNILLEGHTCKIDGLGTFSLSLSFDGTMNPQVSRLNLKVDSEFMRELREKARFTKTNSEIVGVKASKGHIEEHLELALQWLCNHPFITLQDYANITGVSTSTASRELKQITENPESAITTEGKGNRKVWVNAKLKPNPKVELIYR